MNGSGQASGPTVALVVPTRDEATHVTAFVERVDAALRPFPVDWHAEVIDDSEDETAAVLRGLASRGAPLELTHRSDADQIGGGGSAVRAGLGRARGDVICVIDADLQHPPEVLPELLAPILLGRADICVGSRYRRGGSAAGLNRRWRRVAARISGVVVRWLFPATRWTTDPDSGLFAVRRGVLDSLTLRPRGSRVLAEILVRGRWRTVCDVPYHFAPGDGDDNHPGAGEAIALAGELISLLRLDPRLASSSRRRNGHFDGDGVPQRKRVAPVQVELLRDDSRTEGEPARPVRSGGVA